jgi:hypothetical protein
VSIELGLKYRDRITGFEGVATGYTVELTSAPQVRLVPLVGQDGNERDPSWFDIERVELIGGQSFGFASFVPRAET